MPMDEQGNLVDQEPGAIAAEQTLSSMAPPGYGQHILDQLYDDVDMSGFQTPALQSGVASPFYSHSRAGSSENLASMADAGPIAPAALSSRLANVSLDPSQRNTSYSSLPTASGRMSPTPAPQASAERSDLPSAELSRSNSSEERSGQNTPDEIDIDMSEFAELNRVPSYATAVRTPVRSQVNLADLLPDYVTALSAPRTPPATDVTTETLSPISEDAAGESHNESLAGVALTGDDPAGHRRLQLMRGRDQTV